MSPPREAVRRLVRTRRQRAHEVTAAMLSALRPERTADTWLDLGAATERAAARIRRRRETSPRRAAP